MKAGRKTENWQIDRLTNRSTYTQTDGLKGGVGDRQRI